MTSAPLLGEPLPVELMNTIWADRDGVHDSVAGAAELTAWLRAAGHAADVPVSLVDKYRQLRDALRYLAATATADDRGSAVRTGDLASAVATVNECTSSAPAWSELSWPDGGPPVSAVRSAGDEATTVLAAIAERAVQLFTAEAGQLRACHGPGCVLYFVRNHPRREWCSAGCGNRARVARHYRRHHEK
ncbi:MAG: ABATE domain-containing protein [Kibdelosporangium sp.]